MFFSIPTFPNTSYHSEQRPESVVWICYLFKLRILFCNPMAADTATNPERIHAFFTHIESRQALLSTISELHKTLTAHFSDIGKTLGDKSASLDSKISELNEKTNCALAKVVRRKDALPERASALAAQISEAKEAAIAEIENVESMGDLGTKSVPELLKIYCTRMDARGLIRFIQGKRKESTGLRQEVAAALKFALDPLRLILDAAEQFLGMRIAGKKGLSDRRWACDMVIQSVEPVAEGDYGAGKSLKERAARILDKWKGAFGSGNRMNGVCATEATIFLQLIIVFALKERFRQEFLRKLVMEFASRKDMPKLAVALGFGNKIVDIIEELVKNDREIEAVYFAFEAGLTEQFPPVSLLKAHLRNCRRNANTLSRKGRFSSASVEKADSLELEATKAIIKCVEDHELEPEFSLEGLKKRVDELEQAKADRKNRTAPANKHSKKRPRASSTSKGSEPSSSRASKSGRLSNASSHSRNPPQSHQLPPARYTGGHSYTSQIVYEAPSTVSYAPALGGIHAQSPAAHPPQYGYALPEAGVYSGTHTQSPATQTPQYGYTHQEAGVSGVRGYHGSYTGQSGYNAYDYTHAAAAAPSTYPPYPTQ